MSWVTYVRKRKTWEYRWYDQNGKVRSQSIPNVKGVRDAERVRSAWDISRSELESSEIRTDWTLEEVYQKVKETREYSPNYLNNLKTFWEREPKRTQRKGTFERKKERFGILEYFGRKTQLSAIGVPEVLGWIAVIRKHKNAHGASVKNTTINHYRNALSRAYSLAMAYGIVTTNPCKHPEVQNQLKDDTATRGRVLSPEEVRNLLDHARGNVKSFLILAWATGGRMNEILTLEWDDLLRDPYQIRFQHDPSRGKRTKNKKTQVVTVHPDILRYLQEDHRKVEGSNWIFANPRAKGDVPIKTLKKGIQSAVRRAGLEGVSAHVIRHSVGSFLGANGAPLATIRDHLRHGDFRTTNRYSHGIDEEKRKASVALFNALKTSNACADACLGSKRDEAVQRLKNDPEVISAVKSIRKKMREMERETGLEPATLSLGKGSDPLNSFEKQQKIKEKRPGPRSHHPCPTQKPPLKRTKLH